MNVFDRLVLLLTGLIAIYLIWYFVKKQKDPETACSCNIYYLVLFAVLLVAGLIPFSLATGLVIKLRPEYGKGYL